MLDTKEECIISTHFFWRPYNSHQHNASSPLSKETKSCPVRCVLPCHWDVFPIHKTHLRICWYHYHSPFTQTSWPPSCSGHDTELPQPPATYPPNFSLHQWCWWSSASIPCCIHLLSSSKQEWCPESDLWVRVAGRACGREVWEAKFSYKPFVGRSRSCEGCCNWVRLTFLWKPTSANKSVFDCFRLLRKAKKRITQGTIGSYITFPDQIEFNMEDWVQRHCTWYSILSNIMHLYTCTHFSWFAMFMSYLIYINKFYITYC